MGQSTGPGQARWTAAEQACGRRFSDQSLDRGKPSMSRLIFGRKAAINVVIDAAIDVAIDAGD